MKGVGHIAHIGDMRKAYRNLAGNLKRRDYFEDVGLDGKIKL
jgi:hypothetical protein